MAMVVKLGRAGVVVCLLAALGASGVCAAGERPTVKALTKATDYARMRTFSSSAFPVISFTAAIQTETAGSCGLLEGNFLITENNIAQTIDSMSCSGGGGTSFEIEMIVVFDDTGSMSSQIGAMQEGASDFAAQFDELGLDARFALISFSDEAEVDLALTYDVAAFQAAVDALVASGGGDGPEASLDGVMLGFTGLEARSTAQRIFFLITDAPTHYRGDGTDFSAYTMPEVVSALQMSESRAFVIGPDYSWTERDPVPDTDEDVRTLAEESGGYWQSIDDVNFTLFLDEVVNELVSRYTFTYTSKNTRSDGIDRDVVLYVYDPKEGLDTVEQTYEAPYIAPPTFRTLFGTVGYETENQELGLQGFCDSKASSLLMNASTDGLVYTSGASSWSYAATLTEGENIFELVSLDGYGNTYGPTIAYFTYNPAPNLTTILLLNEDLTPVTAGSFSTLNLYDTIRVWGRLDVPETAPALRAGRVVRVRYEFEELSPIDQYTITDGEGYFIDSLRADRVGLWTVRAKFDGDDDLKECGWADPASVVMVRRATDVNKNGAVDALDVQLVINDALGVPVSPLRADANRDGTVDAMDVQLVINSALAIE